MKPPASWPRPRGVQAAWRLPRPCRAWSSLTEPAWVCAQRRPSVHGGDSDRAAGSMQAPRRLRATIWRLLAGHPRSRCKPRRLWRDAGLPYPRTMKTEDSGDGASARLGQPWAQLDLDRDWSDLVLPEENLELLRSICAESQRRDRARAAGNAQRTNGRGAELRVLFSGEPGTGKTLAARVIGAELGREMVAVDLERLAAEEPPDAERSLQRTLNSAEESASILVFDQPEALFGKRPVASRGRKPRFDFPRLVGRLEAHRAPILFATQLKPRVDDELIRRVNFIVSFPFPEAEDRARIWRLLLPADARATDRDLEFLASSFKLSGGAIQESIAAAETKASTEAVPVGMDHIARGLEQQYGDRLLNPSTRVAIDEIHRRHRASTVAPSAAGGTAPPTAAAVPAPRTAEPKPRGEPKPRREPRPPAEPKPRGEPKLRQEPKPSARAAPAARANRRSPPAAKAKRVSTPPPTLAPAPARGSAPRSKPERTAPAPRRRLAVLAVAGAVLAGLLGYVVAHAGSGGSGSTTAPLKRRAATGLLRVSYPSGWKQQAPPATPSLGLADRLALAAPASTGGIVVVGRTTSTDASLLTRQILTALPSRPRPQVVVLGGARFYRYLDLLPSGSSEPLSVYALPTSVGTILGVCLTT